MNKYTIKNIVYKHILWRLNFYKDQRGIISRYLYEKDNWENHLSNTKRFILNSIKELKEPSIAVLGSGWLLDVPVNELKPISKKITLIDIIHPKQIVNRFKNDNKIEFIRADLTGGLIEQIYNLKLKNIAKNNTLIRNLQPQLNLDLNEYNYVISVNILNQLDILLKDYLLKFKIFEKNELNDFSKLVQDFHLKCLPKNKTCLVSDCEEFLYNEKENLRNKLVFVSLPKGKNEEEWEWKFDTRMTYYKYYNTTFLVKAIQF